MHAGTFSALTHRLHPTCLQILSYISSTLPSFAGAPTTLNLPLLHELPIRRSLMGTGEFLHYLLTSLPPPSPLSPKPHGSSALCSPSSAHPSPDLLSIHHRLESIHHRLTVFVDGMEERFYYREVEEEGAGLPGEPGAGPGAAERREISSVSERVRAMFLLLYNPLCVFPMMDLKQILVRREIVRILRGRL